MSRDFGVLKNFLITEKSNFLSSSCNQYVFSVAEWATKFDVASAVESFFNVKVAAVNVINVSGKARRVRSKSSRRYSVVSRGKKAVVRLKDGCKIDLS